VPRGGYLGVSIGYGRLFEGINRARSQDHKGIHKGASERFTGLVSMVLICNYRVVIRFLKAC
jgi:hypothetical protein